MWLFLLFTGFKMCLAYWQHCNPLLCLLSWHPHHLYDMLLRYTGCHSRLLPALVTRLMCVCLCVCVCVCVVRGSSLERERKREREREVQTDIWTEIPLRRQRHDLYLSLWSGLTAHGGNGKKDSDKDGNNKRKTESERDSERRGREIKNKKGHTGKKEKTPKKKKNNKS